MKWTLREEDTFEKRHMNELIGASGVPGIPVKDAWTGLQTLMQKNDAYLKPAELYRYWTLIRSKTPYVYYQH